MFKAREEALALPGFGRAAPTVLLTRDLVLQRPTLAERLATLDLAPDLARDIGSRRWWRGLATLTGLSIFALSLWPGTLGAPLAVASMAENSRGELRSQAINPLALGGDSGRHMAATGLVRQLASAPQPSKVSLTATLTTGGDIGTALQRAGVGQSDAGRVMATLHHAGDMAALAPGTRLDLTLGQRPLGGGARPLETMSFRARFDLALRIDRGERGTWVITKLPIAVDDTPLRIRGTVGPSLYRSARAAGAPADVVQAYLEQLGQRVDLDEGLLPTDSFDIIVEHSSAATGERRTGKLLYAGIDRDGRPRVQLMRWGDQFYEAEGVGEESSGLIAPVPGRVTSHFGMRRHPILGYVRMHAGLDFAAAHGTPIVAVSDGRVSAAGRMGGCGNAVRIDHGEGLQTRYCHMSQIAAYAGQAIGRGQVIGYVGSTGLSTGPHLHYEMYRTGRPVDPSQVTFISRAQLVGVELKRFREALAVLRDVVGGMRTGAVAMAAKAPVGREIDRAGRSRIAM